MARRTPETDPGLQQIADLERDIILAHDQKATMGGAPADEVAQQRPAVEQLAVSIGERLRAEYLARRGTQ